MSVNIKIATAGYNTAVLTLETLPFHKNEKRKYVKNENRY